MRFVSLFSAMLRILATAVFGLSFTYVGTSGLGQIPTDLIHVCWTLVGLSILMVSFVQLIVISIARNKEIAFERDQNCEGLS